MLSALPLIVAAAFLANASALAPVEVGDTVIASAMELAQQEQYDEAITALDNLTPEQKTSYKARFARARILGWSGRFAEAEDIYLSLLAEYPDNADLQIGYAQVAYYQADYDKAEALFTSVTLRYPDYNDAHRGLERVQRARNTDQSGDPSVAAQWRLDYGAELSTFERSANEDWTYYFAQISRSKNKRSLSLQIEHHERFGLDDTTLSVGGYSRIGETWDGAIRVEYTPKSDFRPSHGFDAEVGKLINEENDAGPVVRPYVRYSYDKYPAGAIHTVFPGVQMNLRSGFGVDAQFISTFQRTEDTQIGGSIRFRGPLSDNWRFSIGGADAPEAVDGIVIRTRSVFGSLQYEITKRLSVRASYARDDRENSFIRNAFSVSVTHRF